MSVVGIPKGLGEQRPGAGNVGSAALQRLLQVCKAGARCQTQSALNLRKVV